MRILLAASLAVNLLFLAVGGYVVHQKGGVRYLRQYRAILSGRELTIESFSPYYQSRYSDFMGQDRRSGAVIFAGDSLTEQADWNKLLKRNDIVNRGIGADTSVGLEFRLGEIIKHAPSKIFLMIGVADLRIGRRPVQVLEQYRRILERLAQELPQTRIFVQSILPIHPALFGREIALEDIRAINEELEPLAGSYGATFLDLHSHFSDSEQRLDRAYTVDGVHLNAVGYKKWAELAQKYLR